MPAGPHTKLAASMRAPDNRRVGRRGAGSQAERKRRVCMEQLEGAEQAMETSSRGRNLILNRIAEMLIKIVSLFNYNLCVFQLTAATAAASFSY